MKATPGREWEKSFREKWEGANGYVVDYGDGKVLDASISTPVIEEILSDITSLLTTIREEVAEIKYVRLVNPADKTFPLKEFEQITEMAVEKCLQVIDHYL